MSQAGKSIYLVANWKSNKTLVEMEAFLQQFRGYREEGKSVNIICPPTPYLKTARDIVNNLHLPMKVGAQDVSAYPFGAYTGAVSAGMLLGITEYCIVGHSERRRYFHESNQEIANKITQLLELKMKPILCVDTPYLESQLAALEPGQKEQLIVAYEPLEAIGSGIPATPEEVEKVAEQIQEITQANIPVLYGGSVNADNITSFLNQTQIQGALVGGESLKVEGWKAILRQAATI